MNPKIAKRWIKALRSGKYKQDTGQLRNGDKFCCLGVLCDLHAKETGMEWSKRGCYYEEKHLLPSIVIQWAGLKSNNGKLGPRRSLSKLNDNGASFRKIATVIEKNVEKL